MKKKHLAAILLCVGLLGAASWGGLELYVSQDTLPSGTVVAGLDLGRRQRDDALRLLDQEIAALNRKQTVFSVDGTTKTLTWDEAGVMFDAGAFHEEVQRLDEGSLWERGVARKTFHRHWSLTITFDPKKLQTMFSPEWEKNRFGSPVNAVRTITPQDQIRYLPGTAVQRIDWDRMLEMVSKQLGEEVRRLERNSWHEPTPNALSKQLPTLQFTVPLKTVEPEITVERLKQEGIRRKIVQFSTSLMTSGAGRVHNVDAAARSIDGMVLAPDEIFDYNEVIEYAEKTYGFREAPVIFGGRLTPGVGGGICQVSSTLYNAAVRAGLTIVERRNHSLPVRYLPKGQDATFARGYINFRFKNSSGHHLLIRAEVKNGQLTVKLFGDMPENVSYTLESHTTEVISPPNKYVINRSLPAGSQQVLVRGKQGYVVETYRIKKVDGKAVERTLLSKDTYPAQPNVIAVREIKAGSTGSSNGGDTGSGGGNRGSNGSGNSGRKSGGTGSGGQGGTSGSGTSNGSTSSDNLPKQILEDGVTGPNFR